MAVTSSASRSKLSHLRRPWAAVTGALMVGVALAGCGTSLLATSSTTGGAPSGADSRGATSTTAPLSGEVAVAFPVVQCTTPSGGSLSSQGWKPSVLLAPIPTALVGKVEFYTDNVDTLLAPTGWNCSEAFTIGGTSELVAYPANNPNPPLFGPPAPGTEGIFATFDSTGHASGVALVCPFFTVASWQRQEAKCPSSPPTGEVSSMPTPDVASVTDPAGVVGTLPGSGGSVPVSGAVLFPQVEPAVTDGSSVNVAEEACSLPDPSLCATVLSDFEVREFPVPGFSTNSRTSYAPAVAPTTIPAVRPAPTGTTAPTTTRPAATTTTAATTPTPKPPTPPAPTPPG